MKQIKTPNYNTKKWTDRTNRTHKVPQEWDVIVNHIMEGYAPQTINYIDRPDITVSAHFIIGRKGEIWRQVDLKHGAWHCISRKPLSKIVKGRTAPPNLYTVGIEHEGMHKDTKGKLTAKQYEASLFAHKYIIERYEETFKKPFKIDRDHIIGHYEVDTVGRDRSCPGYEFPFDQIIKDLQAWDKKRKAPVKHEDTVVTTAAVNVRDGASTKSKIIRTLPRNTEAVMVGLSGEWLKVDYKGKVVYSHSDYWNVPAKTMEKFKPKPEPKPEPVKKDTIAPDNYYYRVCASSHKSRNDAYAEAERLSKEYGVPAFVAYTSTPTKK